jgi:hypothetical protein
MIVARNSIENLVGSQRIRCAGTIFQPLSRARKKTAAEAAVFRIDRRRD